MTERTEWLDRRVIPVDSSFSLAQTCGPVAWGKGRWPNVDWKQACLIWVGRDEETTAVRYVRQVESGALSISGPRDADQDTEWAKRVLAFDRRPPRVLDPIVSAVALQYAGMRPFSAGSLFNGVISSIAGQSISVAAAAVTEARLAAMFHPGIEIAGRTFWPIPTPEQLGSAEVSRVRESGVTWRRAEAIVAAGRAWVDGQLPDDAAAAASPDETRAALRKLPLVGPWTAESALLWGIGLDDVFPTNDAALLRAAKLAYARPDMIHRDLDLIAESWRPARAWACRWLWIALFGEAPNVSSSAVEEKGARLSFD